MALSPDTRLGHYDVTALLGEGGMGQVWQATDTQLNRQVALKILPDAFAADPDRLARFKREAQILASLNHPNIAAIYGIEEAEGTRALVLELVEGPTLADRIAKGPIPLDEALPIAKQIAEALEAAHEAGVIHRDLKPANIKVREDGTVKVLDFGLAKALDPAPDVDPSQSPALTAAATQMGVIMGTAAYMAPEQARGKTVDRRADIWAFGAVLFEMLTAKRAFDGRDVSETLGGVLRLEPEWDALDADLPPRLSALLRRCLDKEPRQRVQAVGDVRLAMEGAFETTAAPPSEATTPLGPQPAGWRRAMSVVGVAVVGGVIVGVGVWILKPPTPSPPRAHARFVVNTPPDGVLQVSNLFPDVAVSPDGTHIVYVSGLGPPATRQLYVRPVDQLDATPLRGTDGANFPFFSPDGAWVGFRDVNTLKKVSILGGPAVTIANLGSLPLGVSWGPDDTIIFATAASRGLMRVPSVGGDPEVLTTVGAEDTETEHRWPDALPNGRGVLFTAWSGSDEGSRIALLSVETGEITYLVPGGSHPHYVPTGHIVYGVNGTLRAVGFDLDRLALTSNNPVPVLESVSTKITGAANFSFSKSGTLVYVSGEAGGMRPHSLVWVDRQGREEPLATPSVAYDWVRLSPDGTRAAVEVVGSEGSDVWISDLARGTLRRLTTDPNFAESPLWSQDGQRVVFSATREGRSGLFWRPVDGPGAAEHLLSVEQSIVYYPESWSPDGTMLLAMVVMPGTVVDIGVLSMEGDTSWQPLLATDANEAVPTLSPDGQWIAYYSNETGQREVYVQRFPELGDKRQVSIGGGQDPVWSPDGRELFYLRSPGGAPDAMMVVTIETDPSVTVGTPELLFEGNYWRPPIGGRRYDLSPDGERFLMITSGGAIDDSSTQAQIIVVEGWFDVLTGIVPTN